MENKQLEQEAMQKLIDWIDNEILLNPYYAESPRLRIGAEMVKVKATELFAIESSRIIELEKEVERLNDIIEKLINGEKMTIIRNEVGYYTIVFNSENL